MRSKVYFIKVDNSDSLELIQEELSRLLAVSKLLDFITDGQRVAIKMHFGEEGNTGYVKPQFLRLVSQYILNRKASSFVTDTNALYKGKRTNTKDHLELAYEHGFRPQEVAAEVIIPDDTKKENTAEVGVNGQYIKKAKIARIFFEADALVGLAHFKGHLMTGFGGALKNIGMGCATREGKLAQHSDVSPFVKQDSCIGCSSCLEACPNAAITLRGNRAEIDVSKCIGCASCIAACTYNSIDVDWEAGAGKIQQKMAEYASAVLVGKKGKSAFFNFAVKITKECDCLAKDDPRITPDIGIFASQDPVSVDKACLDAVISINGRDIFKEVHPLRDGSRQLNHASRLGLGSLEYELIAV